MTIDTRLQLHWAAQAVAGVARACVSAEADDSHTSFEWSETRHALMGAALGDGSHAGLRLRDATLLVRGDDVGEFSLQGRTLADAFRFYEERLGGALVGLAVRLPEGLPDGLPDHAVRHGAPFGFDPRQLAHFDALYADADAVLQAFAAAHPGASRVRCWPHHFDIATLITLPHEQTIGAGFSPGDGQFAAPYWYVNAWPAPRAEALPPLPVGRWNHDGWLGALLPAGEGDAAQFLAAAYEALAPR